MAKKDETLPNREKIILVIIFILLMIPAMMFSMNRRGGHDVHSVKIVDYKVEQLSDSSNERITITVKAKTMFGMKTGVSYTARKVYTSIHINIDDNGRATKENCTIVIEVPPHIDTILFPEYGLSLQRDAKTGEWILKK
jgi:hypothetical protein